MTAVAPERLQAIEPIGLPELVARAELLTRVDRKYVLPLSDAEALLHRLPSGTRILEIDGLRSFGYRSTYLDTPDHQSFHAAGRSRRRRWKVRTRCYVDTGGSWLEVKTRSARSHSVKQRVEHPEAGLAGGLTAAGSAFAAGIVGPAARDLQPVLVTGYQRTTLFLPASGSRVTVDVDLGWTALGSGRELDRPLLAIVETKTGSVASEVDRLLWRAGHRPTRISKYGAGMAALHPELSRLKWHRVLQHDLAVPRPTT